MNPFLIRQAKLSDFSDLRQLAKILNTLNLPNDDEELQKTLSLSDRSFRGENLQANEREYLFVVEDLSTHHIVGSSQVIAQHGTRESPHVYYQIRHVDKYSPTVDHVFRHQVLRMGFDYNGPTEVGGLVVAPEYRRQSNLGRQLSFIRFMLIKMHRPLFKDHLLAELLPPLSPSGESLLWEALGRRFTGLHYMKADHISRTNKEFIKNLFPEGDIYTTLFEPAVREVIGAVGKGSQAARHLLTEIGFKYKQHVDPFDGGPHYEAITDEVTPVRKTVNLIVENENNRHNWTKHIGLVAHFINPFAKGAEFLAIQTDYKLSRDLTSCALAPEITDLLKLTTGDTVSVLELPST